MGVVETIYPDGEPVIKSAVRADDKSGHRRNVPDTHAVENDDFSGQTAGLYVRSLQANFDLDTSDSTSEHDGLTVLVDNAGNRFKRLQGGDVAGDTHAAESKATPVDADEIPLVDSAASFILKKLTWANLKATLAAWLVSAGLIRERLTANRTYYIRTDGDDAANNGLSNASGGAFATVQKAIDITLGKLDLAGFNVDIQLGNTGTYTGNISAASPQVGAGTITIVGDVTEANTGGYIVTSSSGTTIAASNGAKLALKGFEVRSTSGMGIASSSGAAVSFAGYMRVGACSSHQIRALNLGTFLASNLTYDVVGGGLMHVNASLSGLLNLAGSTVRIPTGVTAAFSGAFAQADRSGHITVASTTFTVNGTVTGKRYNVESGGVISGTGGNTSLFPGNAAGTGTNQGTSPYGLYI